VVNHFLLAVPLYTIGGHSQIKSTHFGLEWFIIVTSGYRIAFPIFDFSFQSPPFPANAWETFVFA
jgi:hypothetical protein